MSYTTTCEKYEIEIIDELNGLPLHANIKFYTPNKQQKTAEREIYIENSSSGLSIFISESQNDWRKYLSFKSKKEFSREFVEKKIKKVANNIAQNRFKVQPIYVFHPQEIQTNDFVEGMKMAGLI